MNLEDFKNLDPNNYGNWPIPVKGVIIICACVAALGAGYYFDTQHQLIALDAAKNKEWEELRAKFKDQQWKAATLPKLKEQLVEIEKSLSVLQRRLPSEAEVAGLIQDISQAAIASGLKSQLFEPGKELDDGKGVYKKLPIKLQLTGNYHSFGKFISDVAAMPRIVTQHDISITSGDKANTGGALMMETRSQIYRYIEAKTTETKPGTPPAAGGTPAAPAPEAKK